MNKERAEKQLHAVHFTQTSFHYRCLWVPNLLHKISTTDRKGQLELGSHIHTNKPNHFNTQRPCKTLSRLWLSYPDSQRKQKSMDLFTSPISVIKYLTRRVDGRKDLFWLIPAWWRRHDSRQGMNGSRGPAGHIESAITKQTVNRKWVWSICLKICLTEPPPPARLYLLTVPQPSRTANTWLGT